LLSALLADLLSLALLLLAGPAAIWNVLAIYWAENLGFGVAASISNRQGMAAMSDEAWFARAHATLAARAGRPDADETRAQHAAEMARLGARLAQMEAIDRRTPQGRAEVAAMRRLEERASSLVFGCAFGVFAVVHGLFLLVLAGASSLIASAGGLGGLFSGEPATFLDSSGFDPSGLDPSGFAPVAHLPVINVASIGWLLLSMAVVVIAALVPAMRRGVTMAQGDATMRRALTRLFVLQVTIIAGGLLALVLGSAAIAVVFTGIKTAVDLLEIRKRRRGTQSGGPSVQDLPGA
jgi:hypothetical protein